jgi:glycosyltransferase involved in cell wall biosynthesis
MGNQVVVIAPVPVGGMSTDWHSHQVQVGAISTGVVLSGLVTGVLLHEFHSHANLFVLRSSHEGLPIAMLETMSYDLPALASDMPASLEVGLDRFGYFSTGNQTAPTDGLCRMSQQRHDEQLRLASRRLIARQYN